MSGAAGAGKSTLGRELAAAGAATLLDQDVMTNPLMGQVFRLAGIAEDYDHPALCGPVREARYRCLLDTALDNVALGRPVVLVAPFTTEISDPQAWADAFAGFDPAGLALVWVDIAPAVALDRRRRRGLGRDLTALAGEGRSPTRPVVPHVRVDGAAPLSSEVARVLAALGARPDPVVAP